MGVSRAGFMAAICDQKLLTRREVNKFHLLKNTVSYLLLDGNLQVMQII
jgi:hypothetical protein